MVSGLISGDKSSTFLALRIDYEESWNTWNETILFSFFLSLEDIVPVHRYRTRDYEKFYCSGERSRDISFDRIINVQ